MALITLLSLIVGVLLVGAAALYKKLLDMRSNIPSPGLFWFRRSYYHNFDHLLDFVEKTHAGMVHGFFMQRNSWAFGKFLFGMNSNAIITHPDIAQIVLKDEETFAKHPEGFGDVGELMKDSLVNSNGEKWKLFKDILAPAFHFEYIRNLVPVFVDKTRDLLDVWVENGGKGINVRSDLSHFTLDTLGLAAFDIDFKSIRGGSHEYLGAYTALTSIDPNKDQETIRKAQATLTKMTYEIIDSKKKTGKGGVKEERDFLDRLLSGADRITREQIRDNTFLMFLAGHETTSVSLTWTLYYLAKYPEMQSQARAEVDAMLKGKTPDSESVKLLTYIDMFIKEVMRHRPAVATIISRVATKDAQVGSYLIPKDTILGLSIYTIHHLKEFWPEPQKFDPLRFTPENSAGRHPFAYLPFSLGRRNCIGNNFSLLEQKIFLAMVLQRVTLTLSDTCNAMEFPIWQVCWPMYVSVDVTPRVISSS